MPKSSRKKDCSVCQGTKAHSFSHKGRGVCPTLWETKRGRKHWRRNPERNRNRMLRFHYGIDNEIYADLLALGSFRCWICGSTEPVQGRLLSVDHCHKTEMVRGLLCNACNIGVGMFGDSVEKLFLAIRYLKEGTPLVENSYSKEGGNA